MHLDDTFDLVHEASGKKTIFFAIDGLDRAEQKVPEVLVNVNNAMDYRSHCKDGFDLSFIASASSAFEIKSSQAGSGRVVKARIMQL